MIADIFTKIANNEVLTEAERGDLLHWLAALGNKTEIPGVLASTSQGELLFGTGNPDDTTDPFTGLVINFPPRTRGGSRQLMSSQAAGVQEFAVGQDGVMIGAKGHFYVKDTTGVVFNNSSGWNAINGFTVYGFSNDPGTGYRIDLVQTMYGSFNGVARIQDTTYDTEVPPDASLTGWTVTADWTASNVEPFAEDDGRTGGYSAHSIDRTGEAYITAVAVAGETWYGCFMARSISTCNAYISFYNAGGDKLGAEASVPITPSSYWKLYSSSGAAPATTAEVRLRFTGDGGTDDMDLYIGVVGLSKTGPSTTAYVL